MSQLLVVILAVTLTFVSTGNADQLEKILENSQRPAGSVFDPTGVLTPKQQAEISAPLHGLLENEEIDILVVILPEIGEFQPQDVAKKFAEKWGEGNMSSLVLHVPGRDGTPWIFPGENVGTAVTPEVVRKSVSDGEKRAAAEPDDFRKVRAASIEAADAVRYWSGGAVLRSEAIINARLVHQLEFERKRRLLKLAALLGAAALIPMIFGIVLLFTRLSKMGPRTFPPVRKIPRLGAPYSGGSRIESRG
ncbi:TPM domain-containing protein [Luteolibacter sp. AS25]|uniref:TPM domain-containing protein n=1 Tax=Luteolibacter sp. AS25 TaxID=3135776 RepID=UPI00398B510E